MKLFSIFAFFVFVFLGLAGTKSIAAERMALDGYVRMTGENIFFVESQSVKVYKLKAYTSSAEEVLSRLKNFDHITGSARLVDDTLLLESVEFVGLRRLIGYWQSPKVAVIFENFHDVAFKMPSSKSEYKYAVSPSEGNSWRVFFSDQSSVTLGSLTVSENKASIELYDPETGETSQQYDLKKVSGP